MPDSAVRSHELAMSSLLWDCIGPAAPAGCAPSLGDSALDRLTLAHSLDGLACLESAPLPDSLSNTGLLHHLTALQSVPSHMPVQECACKQYSRDHHAEGLRSAKDDAMTVIHVLGRDI